MKIRIAFGLCLILLLALLSACGGSTNSSTATSNPSHSSSAPPSARAVNVTITDSSVQSSVTTFVAAEPYTFVVKNTGKHPHDFIIRQRPGQPGQAPQNEQGILFVLNQLPPGSSRTFTYTFPIATAQSGVPQGNSTSIQLASQLAGPGGHEIAIPVRIVRA
jgi:uncharacterized cupredoxin-like copper-binding protein